MKSYLSLIPISARVRKRQSRMTRICIILAVFLVTSIFSMVEMWMKAETTAMRNKHGDWHIALQNVSEETAEQIRKDPAVAFSSRNYIRFRNEKKLRKTIDNIKEKYCLAPENIEENTAVLMMLGASSNESVNGLYPLAAACFVIILASGVLMISGCMNSNVAQRIRFFCMMRCIGASKQQIVRFVRLEALNWCKTAIPAGCVLGTVTCWILCLILRFLVKGEWADMPLFAVSISGILWGVVVGVITVFIAAQSPARQAAKVSPMAAISGNGEAPKKIGHAADTRFFRVETSLGIYHAAGAGKNLILMTGSFALTIVLFLAFSACLDLVHKLLPSVSNFTPDIRIVSQDNRNSIEPDLTKKIAEIAGVESAFGMMLHTAYPVEINGQPGAVDLYSHSEEMMGLFKKSVISGDVSKVYDNAGNSFYAASIYNQDNRLDMGDRIKIGEEEMEIACVLSEGVGSVSGAATAVCSEETYTRLTGERNYFMVSVVLKKDVTEAAIGKIRDLAGEHTFMDSREENSDVHGSYWVFRFAAYGFLGIISLITVRNIMNSISMGVSARIRQYGAMRAVGMESRQVTRMITAEAVTYAVCGTAVGILLGLWLHRIIYAKVIVTHFGGSWKLPITTMGLVLLLVSLSCIAAVYAPAKRIRNMAITETINEL